MKSDKLDKLSALQTVDISQDAVNNSSNNNVIYRNNRTVRILYAEAALNRQVSTMRFVLKFKCMFLIIRFIHALKILFVCLI